MSLAPLERPVLRWGIPRQGVRALALQCSSAIRARHAAFPAGRAGSRTRLRPHRGRLLRSAPPGCTVDCEDLTRPSTGALWMQGLAYLVPCRSGGGRPHPFAVPAIESQTGGPAPRSTNVVVEGAGPGHPRPFCTVRGVGASGGAESTEAPLLWTLRSSVLHVCGSPPREFLFSVYALHMLLALCRRIPRAAANASH